MCLHRFWVRTGIWLSGGVGLVSGGVPRISPFDDGEDGPWDWGDSGGGIASLLSY